MSYRPLPLNLNESNSSHIPQVALHIPPTLSARDTEVLVKLLTEALNSRQLENEPSPPTPRTDSMLVSMPADLKEFLVKRIVATLRYYWEELAEVESPRRKSLLAGRLNVLAGVALMVASMGGSLSFYDSPALVLIRMYMSFLGALVIVLDWNSSMCGKLIRKRLRIWIKVLETHGGKALLYIFLGSLSALLSTLGSSSSNYYLYIASSMLLSVAGIYQLLTLCSELVR